MVGIISYADHRSNESAIFGDIPPPPPPVFTMFWSGGSLGESCRVPIILFTIDHCRIHYQLVDGAISQY